MIASLAGTVTALTPLSAVIEVGGVGLLVHCSPSTLSRLRVGESASLATTLIVRETELTLYGFADADARDVFEILQSAAGVGPKLAQAVLGVHDPDTVRRAVAEEDLAVLTKVPGIGRKGAQRIVLDLRDRLGPPGDGAPLPGPRLTSGPEPMPADAVGVAATVREALVGLGYSGREADAAVSRALVVLAAPVGEGAAAGGEQAAPGKGDVPGKEGAPGSRAGADSGTGGAPPDTATLLRASLAVLRR
ncbi:Holliday junction DNA helicase subunit RuvA [Frankia casuarinae]|jgi:Holliday junction DNA helicase RuvA|uniref:Holliday junction branch migration complex subunit RuvA n=1 Tax=Frankia casuarinae (strain DSM 45818 / CECT 9043 / HFP020203 / CcI3) TaxID=106370 RepID=Q2JD95_FRACC|nr:MULTISPECIES: Holliday junction branch migration protein RuvA [Frankia]ABD10747.1 Holliday junction DNA helicase subunit RuvA [Frankia casuarinae]ETA02094.1 Holliday junction DNA helicase subunit RuvA [Frankia sp. CcI6]EYT93301.1 Holliday junction DNA helicase subunit RuvA [Frankia casuarinae]KDA43976.1 Holliday junction DNA helicase subunit RuvA [Frankia sp. BMG5.23]KEZ37690.1 Holliday junction DNA helicase subunit RuvA [Frankia sp. CeD]